LNSKQAAPQAVLVTAWLTGRQRGSSAPSGDAIEAAREAKELLSSGGFVIADHLKVQRERADARFFIGSGKTEEIAQRVAQCGAQLAVFDVDLSPAQQRNLQDALKVPVMDRTALILELFAQRARSSEGRLQVQLAQLRHLSTRLVRGWTHLERQRGGLSKTGGPGEKQIELDRRQIASKIKQLSKRLVQLQLQRQTQRRSRARQEVFAVSLVGYTNAGKSTLFNALTRQDSFAADQLFATLDTTTRRCYLAPEHAMVISDTVGFIRGLPHELIEAFKSTLEESVQADLLLHVVDVASSARDAQMQTVDQVLEEIGAGEVPRIVVYNKIDALGVDDAGAAVRAPQVVRDDSGQVSAVYVSALRSEGLDLLREAIVARKCGLAAREYPAIDQE